MLFHKTYISCLWLLVILLSSLFSPSPADERRVTLEMVSNLPLKGRSHAVILKDNFAYVAMNFDGLAIVDISDPEHPGLVRQHTDDITPLHLIIDDDKAYVADRIKGFKVLDLSSPTDPKIVGSFPDPSLVVHVLEYDNYIFLACGGEGVKVYEQTDKAPYAKPVAQLPSTDFSKMITSEDNYLFVADGDRTGLKVIDISTPTSPTLVVPYSLDGICDVIAVRDKTIFLSKRQAGVIIGKIQDDGTVQVISHIKRLKDAIKDLKINDGYLFISSNIRGIEVFDISDPVNPVYCDGILTHSAPHQLAIRDDYLYIADWEAGLTIVRVIHK